MLADNLLQPMQPAQESVPDAPKRRPQDTWLLTGALQDTMPRALEAVRDIIEAAEKKKNIPLRAENWRSAEMRPDGEPVRRGRGIQDRNLRIANRANNFLLLLEKKQDGVVTSEDEDKAREIIDELNKFAIELRPVLAALKVLEDDQAAAPERVMH